MAVRALDSGSPALSSTVTVNIDIADINDNPPTFCSEEGAGAREMEEVCGGEGGAGSAGEEPGGRLWCAGSSAFLFTPPARWAAPAGPVMAQSLVWSTETTSVEEGVEEVEEVEEEACEGWRTSISSSSSPPRS